MAEDKIADSGELSGQYIQNSHKMLTQREEVAAALSLQNIVKSKAFKTLFEKKLVNNKRHMYDSNTNENYSQHLKLGKKYTGNNNSINDINELLKERYNKTTDVITDIITRDAGDLAELNGSQLENKIIEQKSQIAIGVEKLRNSKTEALQVNVGEGDNKKLLGTDDLLIKDNIELVEDKIEELISKNSAYKKPLEEFKKKYSELSKTFLENVQGKDTDIVKIVSTINKRGDGYVKGSPDDEEKDYKGFKGYTKSKTDRKIGYPVAVQVVEDPPIDIGGRESLTTNVFEVKPDELRMVDKFKDHWSSSPLNEVDPALAATLTVRRKIRKQQIDKVLRNKFTPLKQETYEKMLESNGETSNATESTSDIFDDDEDNMTGVIPHETNQNGDEDYEDNEINSNTDFDETAHTPPQFMFSPGEVNQPINATPNGINQNNGESDEDNAINVSPDSVFNDNEEEDDEDDSIALAADDNEEEEEDDAVRNKDDEDINNEDINNDDTSSVRLATTINLGEQDGVEGPELKIPKPEVALANTEYLEKVSKLAKETKSEVNKGTEKLNDEIHNKEDEISKNKKEISELSQDPSTEDESNISDINKLKDKIQELKDKINDLNDKISNHPRNFFIELALATTEFYDESDDSNGSYDDEDDDDYDRKSDRTSTKDSSGLDNKKILKFFKDMFGEFTLDDKDIGDSSNFELNVNRYALSIPILFVIKNYTSDQIKSNDKLKNIIFTKSTSPFMRLRNLAKTQFNQGEYEKTLKTISGALSSNTDDSQNKNSKEILQNFNRVSQLLKKYYTSNNADGNKELLAIIKQVGFNNKNEFDKYVTIISHLSINKAIEQSDKDT